MAFNFSYRGALWADSKNLPIIAILRGVSGGSSQPVVCWVHSDLPSESLHPDKDLLELDYQHRAYAHASLVLALLPGKVRASLTMPSFCVSPAASCLPGAWLTS